MISSLFARGASVSIKKHTDQAFSDAVASSSRRGKLSRSRQKRLCQRRCDSRKSRNSILASFLRHGTNERDYELLEAGMRVAALKGSKVRDLNLGQSLVVADCWNGRFTRCAAMLEAEQIQHWLCCAGMQHEIDTSVLGSNPTFILSAKRTISKLASRSETSCPD